MYDLKPLRRNKRKHRNGNKDTLMTKLGIASNQMHSAGGSVIKNCRCLEFKCVYWNWFGKKIGCLRIKRPNQSEHIFELVCGCAFVWFGRDEFVFVVKEIHGSLRRGCGQVSKIIVRWVFQPQCRLYTIRINNNTHTQQTTREEKTPWELANEDLSIFTFLRNLIEPTIFDNFAVLREGTFCVFSKTIFDFYFQF